MSICHACQKEIESSEKPKRHEICPYCRSDLHCCLNCELYDEYAENKCHEPAAEWVNDREKNNFCEFFTWQQSRTGDRRRQEQAEAKAKLEALFKKEST
jgi:hypothetical protein